MIFTLFCLFSFIILITAFEVIFSKNAVFSVLFLVLSFCNASFLILLLEIDFIAFLFIIIYVGAIAVLFLFVVIMLDLKESLNHVSFFKYMPIAFFFGLAFFFELFYIFTTTFFVSFNNSSSYYNPNLFIDWFFFSENLSTLELLGNLLYTFYFFFFLVAGMVLLVSIIGAIVLTLQVNVKPSHKKQEVFQQLSRNVSYASFLVKSSLFFYILWVIACS